MTITVKRHPVGLQFKMHFAVWLLLLLQIVLLLMSLNFNNNAALFMTFLLFNMFWVANLYAARNALPLEFQFLGAAPVYRGQTAQFKLRVCNPRGFARYNVQVNGPGLQTLNLDLAPHSQIHCTLQVITTQRGWLPLQHINYGSDFPLGLVSFRRSAAIKACVLVYPKPRPPPHLNTMQNMAEQWLGETEEFVGLRDYRPGDSPGRIAWKRWAAQRPLLSKQFDPQEHCKPIELNWQQFFAATETRLAWLSHLALQAYQQRQTFALTLPGQVIPAGQGQPHLHTVLKALAVFTH